jgi:hypothetical protein
MSNLFQKAVRSQAKLKLAITGPSGSGKTFSALRLAKGMGGKVAVIDTENGSASLYSDRFEFDVLELEPPFTTDKYIAAIQGAVAAGYQTLIIDSATHQWAGEGGILDRKAKMDSRPGSNSYTNWNTMTPEHEKFKSAILQSDIHVIVTLRSKQEYILETNDKGKQAPKKVGLAPIQRDALEYEFTVVFDIAMNHEAEVSKDRTGLFVDKVFQVSEQTGETVAKWLAGAAPKQEPPKPAAPQVVPQLAPVGLPVSHAPEVYHAVDENDEPISPCHVCGTDLKLTQRRDAYYCPQYKDVKDGQKHSYIPVSAEFTRLADARGNGR